ncbi:hypothetical protein Tco_1336134 [Tanacetum coccineum]
MSSRPPHHHFAAAVGGAARLVAAVDTADSTGHTAADHNQVGYMLHPTEYRTYQPCAQTLHGTWEIRLLTHGITTIGAPAIGISGNILSS